MDRVPCYEGLCALCAGALSRKLYPEEKGNIAMAVEYMAAHDAWDRMAAIERAARKGDRPQMNKLILMLIKRDWDERVRGTADNVNNEVIDMLYRAKMNNPSPESFVLTRGFLRFPPFFLTLLEEGKIND